MSKPQAPETRFWAKVNIGAVDACWPWTASLRPDGYGQFRKPGKYTGVWASHRAAWLFSKGPIADGLCVCHKCDNPACCNPSHLFLGSHADNVRDKVAKNRHPHGENHYKTKLRDGDVIEIRTRAARGESQLQIARAYDVNQSTVSNIIRGENWAHVPMAQGNIV